MSARLLSPLLSQAAVPVRRCPDPASPTPSGTVGTALAWDMPTLLQQSSSTHATPDDWARLMNARCDNFAVVLLQAASVNHDYGSTASAVPWVHYDQHSMWLLCANDSGRRGLHSNLSVRRLPPCLERHHCLYRMRDSTAAAEHSG